MHEYNKKVFQKTGLLDYIEKGYDGSRVKIGVIDRNFKTDSNTAQEIFGDKIINKYTSGTSDYNSHGSQTCAVINLLPNITIYLLPTGTNSLEWCLENDIDVVTMSISYPTPTDNLVKNMEEISKQLFDKGVVLINSAGNNEHNPETSTITYPGCSKYWLSVGACRYRTETERFELEIYSSTGIEDDKYWQTVEILGAAGLYVDQPQESRINTERYFGTSCAAPSVAVHVCAYIDLLKKDYGNIKSPELIRRFFHDNGYYIHDQNGYSYKKGYGLVTLPKQLLYLEDYPDDIKGHWNQFRLMEAVDKGWIQGYNNGEEIRPDENITRAEMIDLLFEYKNYLKQEVL